MRICYLFTLREAMIFFFFFFLSVCLEYFCFDYFALF